MSYQVKSAFELIKHFKTTLNYRRRGITTTMQSVLVAEAAGEIHFRTILLWHSQGRRKGDPKHKCCGKNRTIINKFRKVSNLSTAPPPPPPQKSIGFFTFPDLCCDFPGFLTVIQSGLRPGRSAESAIFIARRHRELGQASRDGKLSVLALD